MGTSRLQQQNSKGTRRGLFGALLVALAGAGILLAAPVYAADDARILQRSGDLFAKPEKGEHKAVPAEQNTVPSADTVESGAPVADAAQVDTIKNAPKDQVVLSYDLREVATLTTGATVHRSAKDAAKPHYTLTGPVHLMVYAPKAPGKDAKEPEALTVTINGVALEVTEAHLFYDGWTSPARIVVVSGSAVVPLPKEAKPEAKSEAAPASDASADAKPDAAAEAKPGEKPTAKAAKAKSKSKAKPAPEEPAGPITLVAGQVLVLDPEGPKLLAKAEPAKPGAKSAKGAKGTKDAEAAKSADAETSLALAKWSTVPGFEAPGPFKAAGFAVPSDDKVTIKRNGVDSKLEGKHIPVMEWDEISVASGQKVELQLNSKDKIALTGEAKFKLEVFGAKNVLPAFVFNFLGKVRALISPKDPGSIQFRSVTAVIGVKGTDFEAVGSASNTDVSVLEGKVGVGDASGANEVDVPAGQSTSVAAGAKPLAPKPLSPEKLKELQGEAPAPSALNITAPTEAVVLAGGKIEFTVDPPSASIEVLLDDKALPDFKSGTALPDLSDGAHKVTVRGTAPGALSKSVSFTVDRKPPALDAGIALASLTLVEGTTPPVLKWNKALASAEASYDGKTFPLTLSADGQSAPLALDPTVLKDVPTAIKIKATDKVGNSATSDGMLTFKRKPTKPPVLTANMASPEWITNAPTDLKVAVDREVDSWEVMVGTQNVTDKVVPKDPKAPKPVKEVTVPAALLLALTDGSYPIAFKATDSFGLVGEYKVTLKLDRKAPEPTVKSAKDGAAIALAAGAAQVFKPGKYDFALGEPMKEIKVQLDGQDQPVTLPPAKDGFTLDADSLKPGDHNYKVHIVDLAGNARDLDIKVTVEAPPPPPVVVAAPVTPAVVEAAPTSDREGLLRNAYEKSMAEITGEIKDEMYLGERSQFVFVQTTSGSAGAHLSGKAVYSQSKPPSAAKNVPQAFMREVSEE